MKIRNLVVLFAALFSLVCGSLAQNNSIPTLTTSSSYILLNHGAGVDGSYNASTHLFSATGSAVNYMASATARAVTFCTSASCPTPTFSLNIQVDNSGNLIGGNPTAGQPDFALYGQVVIGGTTYTSTPTSPLLTGQITQFYYDGHSLTYNFDFRFAVTGGLMASLYLNPPSLNNDLWFEMNLEAVAGTTDFQETFASNFGGEIKGNLYGTPGLCLGTIGDFVWNDLNNNGIQDAGEPGLNGVTVDLYNSSGTLIGSTVTEQGPTGSLLGYYQFAGVCAGTYTVKVDTTTLPQGVNGQTEFVATTPNAPGSTTANDSNPNPDTVTLATNDTNDTIDFGFVALQGAIGDYVWFDANNNGLQDASETGINGVTVWLYNSAQTTLLATTTTAFGGPNNVNGYYQFTGLGAGSYNVVVDSATLPPNYSATTAFVGSNTAIDSNGVPGTGALSIDAVAPVTLATDSSTNDTIDFGYTAPCNGTIGQFVWHDLNLNGIQDAGEPGISGVSLILYDSTHTQIQTAITSATGYYQFTGLCEGTYEVDVVASTLPPNFTPTTPQAPGSTPANDSIGSPAPVTLTLDTNNNVVSDEDVNFGYVSPCDGAIGDFVWNDQNGNGIQDAGEPGIANVTVSLFNAQQTLLNSTTTIQNGYYQFTGLCAGTYIVEVTTPTGYSPTVVNAPGSTTANDSNPSPSTVVLSITDNNGDVTNDETIDFGFVLPAVTASCVQINAMQGLAITPAQLVASGGLGGPYTFTATGLPPGLVISSTGIISGTPTATGTYPYTVTITDNAGNTGTLNCTITVILPPTANCVSLGGIVGVPFDSGPMSITGGTAPFVFTVVGTLPAGLTLNPATGEVSGTPTAAGTYSIKATDANNATTTGCAVTINPAPLSVTCAANNAGTVGVPFNSGPLTVSGGTTPYMYSIVGTLPAGLTLNAANGAITGTPTTAGSFSIQVTDADSNVATTTCSITIVYSPVTASCVAITAEQGIAIAPTALTATGGSGSGYIFTAAGLPAGLSISSAGVISGTPTVSGTFPYTVTIKDDAGNTGSFNCSITVTAPPVLNCSTVTVGEVGVAFSSPALTTTGGTAPYLYTVVGTLPAGLTLNSATGAVSGTPTSAGTFAIQVMDAAGNTSTNCSITINVPPSVSCAAINTGDVGVPFDSGIMNVTGGTAPYSYSIVGTLPAGLSLNTATGEVTGTPTAAGSFSVRVTDASGNSSTNCVITINGPLLVTCAAINTGDVGVAFDSGPMNVSGGTPAYSYSIIGTLPAGLTLNPATGEVTGTPTTAGSFTIQVTDATGNTSTGCMITINGPLVVSCAAINTGDVGAPFNSGPMNVTGGTGPYSYSIVGTLPAGLTLNTSTGAVSGTPTSSGSFTVRVTDATGNSSTSCMITINGPLSVTCAAITTGDVGAPFNSGPMNVTGGTAPYSYSIVGILPAGLTLNTATGAVTGTPTSAGSFTVRVTDATGNSSTSCVITINGPLLVTCAAINTGDVGVAFDSGPMSVSGGTPSYSYSIIGTLPAGLTLNPATGEVTGTPTAAGSFTIQVTDATGNTSTGCMITINGPLAVSCAAINTGDVGAPFNSGPMNVTGGTAPYSYSIVGILPAGLTLNPSTGAVTGTPTASGTFTVMVTDATGNSSTSCMITINQQLSLSCSSVTAGEVGVAFSSPALTVTGGTAPYTYSVVGTLPSGLTLNTATGAVTGTPTTAGSFSIQVKDANGQIATTTCSITIVAAPSLSCSSVTAGEVGVAFSSPALTVTGGTAPYTYSVVGTLPAGLTLNTATGAVTGTPTTSGSFSIQVKDANGQVATTTCSITIVAAPSLSCSSVTAGEVGVAFSSPALTVTGGTAPYTYSVVGTLPAGLTLNAATGAVTGTPTTSGSFSIQVKDANGQVATTTCSITIVAAPSLSCSSVTAGEVGVAFSSPALTVTGGTAPYTYSVVGTLPAGLTLNTATGAVTGTPTTSGSFSIQVKDANGQVATTTCSITIVAAPSLSCSSVTAGEVGVAFSSPALTVTGGTAPYTYSVVGTLPSGLTLNSATGAVTGTPTTAGSFSIQVKDANGQVATTTCSITIVAAPALSCSSVTAGEVGVAFSSPALTVTGGTAPYTYSVVGTLPAGLTLNPATGAVTGTPTTSGSFSIQVKDANSQVATTTCSITIVAAPTVSCSSVTAGEVGVAFSSPALTVTGGTAPYTYSVVGTLPAGLTLNPATGAVTGTPTTSGSFSIQVKDANGQVATTTCSITIVAAPSLSCSSVTAGEVGVAFSSPALTVTGGTAPYTYSVVGTLPSGLTLNSATGAVTGTPTTSGSFSIQVKDANGRVATTTCSITIVAAPSASCLSIDSVQGDAIVAAQLVASGGSGTGYTFTATGLPAGLTISSTGLISGTPTVNGTFSYTVTITDSKGNKGTLTCSITVAPPVVHTCITLSAAQGTAITPVTLTASGGAGGPYTFTGSGFPAGLTLSSSGVLSGTPTVSGTFTYTVTVTDKMGNSGTGGMCSHTGSTTCTGTITVTAAPSASCLSIDSVQGDAIVAAQLVASGGSGTGYTFTATGLPTGLSISSTGVISGTPTVNGSFSYTVTITDSKGNKGTLTCSITVAPPVVHTCITLSATQGTAITPVTLTASGGAGGPYTFTGSGFPAGLTLSSSGVLSGTPTVSGTFTYTVTVTDQKGNSGSGGMCSHTGTTTCTGVITVAPGVSASCLSIDSVQGDAIVAAQLVASGGSGTGYSFTATGLPAGLSISSTGVISGTPTVNGTFSYTVTITDSKGNKGTLTCSITVAPPVVHTCITLSATQGTAITPVTLTASGGAGGPYTFTGSGFPAGLTLSSSGVLSGTPTVSGTFTYTVTVTDQKGNSGSGGMCSHTGTTTCTGVITVAPGVSASCLSIDSVQGDAIVAAQLVASGGSGTGYSFTATGLPAGLSISSTGVISGTPTVNGTFSYTVTITDSKGNKGTLTCSITVAPPVVHTCITLSATQGTAITPVTLTANGGAGGPYTFTGSGFPAGLTLSSSGVLSGTPTVSGTFTYTVTVTDQKGNSGTSGMCSHSGSTTCTGVITVAAAPTTKCSTCTFGVASAYNLIALTGNISTQSDITGRIAAAGQVSQSTTIGSGLRTNDPYISMASSNGGPFAIVAAGGITTSNSFNVNAGGNVYSSTSTNTSFNFANENYSGSLYTNSKLVTGGTSPINFSTLKTEMQTLTTQLAALTANGVVCTVSNSGTLVSGGGCPTNPTYFNPNSQHYSPSWIVLYGTSTTTNVFNLTQAQFQSSNNNLDIEVPTGSTVIINVAGTSNTLHTNVYYQGNTVSDSNAGYILFNFATATTVTINGQFDGTLIAPYAALSGGSQMGGVFIAASIGSTGEVHYDPFTSSLPISGPCSQ